MSVLVEAGRESGIQTGLLVLTLGIRTALRAGAHPSFLNVVFYNRRFFCFF